VAKSKKKKKTPPAPAEVPGTLSAAAKDRLGNVLKNVSFTWSSSEAKVLYFKDPSKGDFTATVTKGTTTPVTVTATAPNGKQNTITVMVGP
jgi:Big-like domain-containing protein